MARSRSKGDASWKSVVEFAGAHMHEEHGDDRLDRTVETMSGHLTRNPSYVEATFQPLRGMGGWLSAVAISPSGTIAMVLHRAVKEGESEEEEEVSVVTWRDGSFSRPRVFAAGFIPLAGVEIRVLFPAGSDEPAVIIGGSRIVWGDWKQDLPWADDTAMPEGACLTMWQVLETRHVAFLEDGHVRHYAYPVATSVHTTMTDPDIRGGTRWIGLVGGSLARITVENGRDVLYWRDWRIPMEVPKRKIIETSLAVSGDDPLDLTFLVALYPGVLVACHCYNGAMPTERTCPSEQVYFDRGRIFVVKNVGSGWHRVLEFRQGVFERVDEDTPLLSGIADSAARVDAFGSTVVVSNFALPAKAIERRVCIVTPGHGTSAPYAKNDLALRRFHHGIGLHRRDGTIHWETPTAADFGVPLADFPLYGTPFDRLTPVEDERGRAVMSWVFTDGTFHVLRYPIPK